jgi:hypothetical protein
VAQQRADDAVTRGIEASTSFSDSPRGHQNSSASLWITQSAPKSVAAMRAMRVTHSA